MSQLAVMRSEITMAPPAPAIATGALRWSLVVGRAACLARLNDARFSGSPFQSAGFADAYWTAGGQRGTPIVLVGETAMGTAALLPLTVRRSGFLRIAEAVGGTHSNTLAWRLAPGANPPVLQPEMLAQAASAAGIRIDALLLRRVEHACMLGSAFTVRPAPEARFSLGLVGGLEAVLALGNGKRKRKKFRSQQRHFEAVGGYRVRALPAGERAEALNVFLAAKAAQFAEKGDPDPFAEPGVHPFLHRLFVEETDGGAAFYVLEARGKIKALFAGLREGETFWGMFSAYVEDEDAEAAPGELLRWHLVELLAADGVTCLDLGPGSERYKSSWCDREIPQHDGVAALTGFGQVAVAGLAAATAIESAVKSRPALKSRAQSLRRIVQKLRLAGR